MTVQRRDDPRRAAGRAPARHSPTKPIGPGQGDGGGGEHHGQDDAEKRVRADRHAEHRRGVVTQAEQVEPAGQQQRARRWPATTTGAACRNASRPSWLSEPLPQANRLVVSWLEEDEQGRRRRACRASATAEPASTGGSSTCPPRRRARAPARPRPGRRRTRPGPTPRAGRDSPNAATTVTARYGPAVTAEVSGEASALRASDWNRAPATPRAKPTASPAASRGIREPTGCPWIRHVPSRSPSAHRSPSTDAGGALGEVPAGDRRPGARPSSAEHAP